MSFDPSRREILKTALAAGAASLLPAVGGLQTAMAEPKAAGEGSAAQAFRFVHFTDVHVEPELHAAEGLAQAIRKVESLSPKADFIIAGGDMVFDVLAVGTQKAKELFDLYRKVFSDNTSIKVYNGVGNHDVFGWRNKQGVTPTTPGYGKAMVKDLMHLPDTHYKFDHKGWRFFLLDNIQPAESERAYQGYIDEAQLHWLDRELDGTPAKMPIVTCEHIPMISVTPFDFEQNYKPKHHEWRLDNALVCGDAPERLKLYRKRNVRLCLSGHIHQRDNIELHGTTFINDGAVCGSWWKGSHYGVKEGFGVIDVQADGTFKHQYMDYGWKSQA